MTFFGYGISDFIPCELTGDRCVDINHIKARGMGGSKKQDHIDNLIGLTRELHYHYGDKTEYVDFLIKAHKSFIITSEPYIITDPHDVGFDLLLKTTLKNRLEWLRQSS